MYPWGHLLTNWPRIMLNYCDKNCPMDWAASHADDGYAFTAPVQSYPEGASWVGALNLAGNVWEWVADWYGAYPSELQVNPTGPANGEYLGLRGGSWYNDMKHVRGATRHKTTPDHTSDIFGFRCVISESAVQ